MESQQYPQPSQPILPNGDAGRLPRLFQRNASPEESDEGGLKLGQVVGALRRRVLVIAGITTVVTAAAVLKGATSVPTYLSGFEILTKPITVETQVISSVPQTLAGKDQQQSDKEGIDGTKLKLLLSPKILNPVVKQVKVRYPDMTYDALVSQLTVKPVPSSEILAISIADRDPAKVKLILELVSKAYLEYSLQERLADVRKGIEFVENQLPKLQDRVQTIQQNLQQFRQEYNLVDPESQGKQLSEQMGTFEQQQLDTQIKLKEAQALYRDLQNQLAQPSNNESAAVSVMSDNPRYQKLLDDLLAVDAEIAKESSLFLEQSPNVQVLETQRQNLAPLLSREGQRVQAQMAGKIRELEARDQALTTTQDYLNQRVKQLSVISRQYVDIQRELQIATENLNQFLTKREALRIDAGQRETPWQVLTPITEPVRSAGDTKKMGLLGAILGLLLGAGAAIVIDKLRDVLHTPEEVKDASGLPLLGVTPHNAELQEIEQLTLVSNLAGLVQQVRDRLPVPGLSKNDRYGASPFLESFRSLYTNVRLLNSDTRIRSLTITSATPGDGKSTTALYLAQAAAALGQRVLLVDTDLRRPQIHNRLKLDNDWGLSSVIASEISYKKAIQPSPLEANLYILTAGLIPPDPTRLLSSQRMQHLMQQFEAEFDLVIYDMPPVVGLADAKLIAPNTDGIIVVVGLGSTRRSAMTQALESLKVSPVGILGTVANGSRETSGTMYQTYLKYYSTPNSNVLKSDAEMALKPLSRADYDA